MEYTAEYVKLKNWYLTGGSTAPFPHAGIDYRLCTFRSAANLLIEDYLTRQPGVCKSVFSAPDHTFPQNNVFTYPVLLPKGSGKARKAILLLHGLNERNWIKYLPWACYLAESLQRPVILFPIAFHINRSPEWWGNPRKLMEYIKDFPDQANSSQMSTIANRALSDRLWNSPLRFYTSGKQSADDIVELAEEIRKGSHPLFNKGTDVDVFAYSIGAFLAQVLFIANPDGIFHRSRLFLFCGGAFFEQMNGVSKVIMDKPAFERLHKYYLHDIKSDCDTFPDLSFSLNQTVMGRAFNSMITPENQSAFREFALSNLKGRVLALAMQNDQVIPAAGIDAALGFLKAVKTMEFSYPCSHENPFPAYSNDLRSSVDGTFTTIFRQVVDFLR